MYFFKSRKLVHISIQVIEFLQLKNEIEKRLWTFTVLDSFHSLERVCVSYLHFVSNCQRNQRVCECVCEREKERERER